LIRKGYALLASFSGFRTDSKKKQRPPKATTEKRSYEKPVSLFPLDFETAMKGLLGMTTKEAKQKKRVVAT
jgi:hypothetical protein